MLNHPMDNTYKVACSLVLLGAKKLLQPIRAKLYQKFNLSKRMTVTCRLSIQRFQSPCLLLCAPSQFFGSLVHSSIHPFTKCELNIGFTLRQPSSRTLTTAPHILSGRASRRGAWSSRGNTSVHPRRLPQLGSRPSTSVKDRRPRASGHNQALCPCCGYNWVGE